MSVPQKIIVISSSSDIEKLPLSCSEIRFRKFVSKPVIISLIEKCKSLRKVAISKSAYERCDKKCIEILKQNGVKINVSGKRGRPSMVELMIW